jgi:hypothetical protein
MDDPVTVALIWRTAGGFTTIIFGQQTTTRLRPMRCIGSKVSLFGLIAHARSLFQRCQKAQPDTYKTSLM